MVCFSNYRAHYAERPKIPKKPMDAAYETQNTCWTGRPIIHLWDPWDIWDLRDPWDLWDPCELTLPTNLLPKLFYQNPNFDQFFWKLPLREARENSYNVQVKRRPEAKMCTIFPIPGPIPLLVGRMWQWQIYEQLVSTFIQQKQCWPHLCRDRTWEEEGHHLRERQ